MSRPTILPCLVLPCVVLLCLLGRATPALAQSDIHHCIGANGSPVFTDQPCAALHATPVSPAAAAASPPAVAVAPTDLCAVSVAELRQSVIDAFARRDSVRLAGLILWDGYGRGAAIADIRALTALMKQPLLEVDTPQTAASADPDNDDLSLAPVGVEAPRAADQLVLRTLGNATEGAAPQWRFDIVRRAGCLWLRNAN